jgi:hypothetical protein
MMRGSRGTTYDLVHLGLKMMKPALFVGCLIVGLPLMSAPAAAHVKWFVNCNVSDTPLPFQAVFTTTFFVFFGLFLILLYLCCVARADGARCDRLAIPGRSYGRVASPRG